MISDELKAKANQKRGEFSETVLTELAKIPVFTVDEFQVSPYSLQLVR